MLTVSLSESLEAARFRGCQGSGSGSTTSSILPVGDSGPVVSGGYLFAVGETRRVSDGSLVRTWPACPQSDIAVDGTTVFATSAASGTSRVEAFDGVTGATRWTAAASTPPTMADDLVLVGAGSAVIAYDEMTGRPVVRPAPPEDVLASDQESPR